jgi:hypothetical protein
MIENNADPKSRSQDKSGNNSRNIKLDPAHLSVLSAVLLNNCLDEISVGRVKVD